MAYTTFKESGMTTQDKVDGLNALESAYDDSITYMNAMTHDIYTEAESDSRYYKTASHPSGRDDTGEGCGINAAKLQGLSLLDIQAGAMPHGVIGMWGVGSIPEQYAECNGLFGTPDLRNYFLRGAGGGYNPGTSGGSNTKNPTSPNFTAEAHVLTAAELPIHNHTYTDNYNYFGGVWGGADWGSSSRTTYTTSTNGYTGTTPDGHTHAGCTFTWTGYKDQGSVSHLGALDNRPPYIAVKFVMVL